MQKELKKCQETIVDLQTALFELYHEGDENGQDCANQCSPLINKMVECNKEIVSLFDRLHQES